MLRRGKILSLILTVGMLSANIYGCSSSNNATEDGVAKITVWTQEGQVVEQEYYKNAIEQFNELYAGEIEASLQMIPRGNGYEYENKINAAATSPKTADAGMNMAMILVVVIAATGAVVYARRRMNYTK